MASNDGGPTGPEQLELFEIEKTDPVEDVPPKHPTSTYHDTFPGIDEPIAVEASACTLGEYLEQCGLPLMIWDDPEEDGYLVVLNRYEENGDSMATVDWMPATDFEEQFEKLSPTVH